MLRQIADGVLIHESEFLQSNAVVVQGGDGVLVIDPGVLEQEIGCLAQDLDDLGQSVVAGFSTHPHWDHLLWHTQLGPAPRYSTARCAAAIGARLADPGWKEFVARMMPSDLVARVSLDQFGLVTGVPATATTIPWDGPTVRIIEHRGHALGHASLLIEDRGVLVAGDMLSDGLIPFLDLNAATPIEDYLAALRLIEDEAGDAEFVIPGHGSVGGTGQVRERIDQDRAYLEALKGGGGSSDPRFGPSAPHGSWLPEVHERQRHYLV
jgi:glyoxylase-like metal-dependent hydrolase (beta-lactamase superfamily II)